MTVFGWDIGGVNTKVARIEAGEVAAVRSRPYELQHAPHELARVLRELAAEVSAPGASPPVAFRCAVTMTAELSQVFRTKREGVAFVLDAVETAFPSADVHVYTVDGGFLDPAAARRQALNVAAANWAATARLVGVYHPDAVLVDVGTTTTDIIPIVAGEPAALGRTDPDRLASGELVYTGAVRTPIEAIASAVPFAGGSAGVSAEGFALAGDVHVWRGDLDPADYGVATPDRRPVTRAFTGERLARVVCADRDLIDDRGVWAIADAVSSAQVDRIAAAVRRVSARHPAIATAVVTGLGAFLGDRAARAAGLDVVPLASELGDSAARCAPAACVALLLDRQVRDGAAIDGQPVTSTPARSAASPPVGLVDVVVKLGGGVLAAPDDFEAALAAIGRLARERRVLVVPGGGPFADAVRNADRRLGLSDDSAHWMAVLAMDQYAHLITSRSAAMTIIERPEEIPRALGAGRLPVLAPSRWLRDVDPLPHSWQVTGDSIAAWVAGQVGASEVVLIKPPRARGDDLVDAYFSRARPAQVNARTVPADQLETLTAANKAG